MCFLYHIWTSPGNHHSAALGIPWEYKSQCFWRHVFNMVCSIPCVALYHKRRILEAECLVCNSILFWKSALFHSCVWFPPSSSAVSLKKKKTWYKFYRCWVESRFCDASDMSCSLSSVKHNCLEWVQSALGPKISYKCERQLIYVLIKSLFWCQVNVKTKWKKCNTHKI